MAAQELAFHRRLIPAERCRGLGYRRYNLAPGTESSVRATHPSLRRLLAIGEEDRLTMIESTEPHFLAQHDAYSCRDATNSALGLDQFNAVAVRVLDQTNTRAPCLDARRSGLGLDAQRREPLKGAVEVRRAERDVAMGGTSFEAMLVMGPEQLELRPEDVGTERAEKDLRALPGGLSSGVDL